MALPVDIDLQAIGEALRTAFDNFGYPLAFFGALMENTIFLGLVLPGGSVVLAAAAYARLGDLQWPLVVLLGWLGMVGGNCIDYWVGRKALRPVLDHFGKRRSFVEHFARARAFLDKHGPWAVATGHFLGHLRSFIALAAGSSHFSFPRYLSFELAAAFVWNLVYCSLGYLLAAHLDTLRLVLERMGLVGMSLLAAALLTLYVTRRLATRSQARARPELRLKTAEPGEPDGQRGG